VAVTDTTVLSQSLAAQRDETVDPNQELRALGVANLTAGLFQGFAISSSASRTPVAVAAGARSQLTPLVGAVTIALLLLAPGALRDLPLPMLGAIVITAAIGLIEVAAVRRLYRVRRSEFVLWLAAFFGVALLGVLLGIFVAILRRWPTSSAGPGARTMPSWVARTSSRATTTSTATRRPGASPACSSTASMRPCSSPTPATSAAGSGAWSPRPPTPSTGWWSPPSPSPTSTAT
jgi:Sulfate permease family